MTALARDDASPAAQHERTARTAWLPSRLALHLVLALLALGWFAVPPYLVLMATLTSAPCVGDPVNKPQGPRYCQEHSGSINTCPGG